MALQVTLVKTPGGVSVSRTSHLFNEQGGTFGRAATNSWQLPDPDKFLSSCHCEILWVSDGYYLVDRSTNGCCSHVDFTDEHFSFIQALDILFYSCRETMELST